MVICMLIWQLTTYKNYKYNNFPIYFQIYVLTRMHMLQSYDGDQEQLSLCYGIFPVLIIMFARNNCGFKIKLDT